MNMDPGTWSERVAAQVRAEMKLRRLTVGGLAGILGVARQTASRRLRGETAFDLAELEQIAAWLGMSASELLAQVDPHVSDGLIEIDLVES
jgi:transcriptional regulator with XRE-family HTH domain